MQLGQTGPYPGWQAMWLICVGFQWHDPAVFGLYTPSVGANLSGGKQLSGTHSMLLHGCACETFKPEHSSLVLLHTNTAPAWVRDTTHTVLQNKQAQVPVHFTKPIHPQALNAADTTPTAQSGRVQRHSASAAAARRLLLCCQVCQLHPHAGSLSTQTQACLLGQGALLLLLLPVCLLRLTACAHLLLLLLAPPLPLLLPLLLA